MATDFSRFIGNDPANNLNLQALVAALQQTMPPESVYQPVDTEQFRSQAEEEASPFYDKNLDLALRSLEQARTQQRQLKEQSEKFQAEDFGVFQNVQDRNFARVLQRAQSGFSGRGTFTSGFRGGAINELQTDQQQILSDEERRQRQATEGRNLGFEQFLGRSGLEEEQTRLNIARQKEQEVLSRQQQIANQVNAQNSAIIDQSSRDFARFIGGKLSA